MAKTIGQFDEALFAENDGSKFSKTKDKLIKTYAESNREGVLDILIRYAKSGGMLHWRNFLMTDIIALVNSSETKFSDFFAWALTQPELIYWGMDGLLKTKGQHAYQALIEIALQEELPDEVRAKAIKSIAVHSRQPFDRDLPTDPGYWKAADLRIKELLEWQAQGYRQGAGYAEPLLHPSLKDPQTALEKAAAKLDRKLAQERKQRQDLSDPSNWLAMADEQEISEIRNAWTLPEHYLTFLMNYSPVKVFIDDDRFFQGLWLYGAGELIERQKGYSFNALTGKPIADWPPAYVVIADAGADPYCIDTGNIQGKDAPVYTAVHGVGRWEFELYTDSFLDFLEELAVE